MSTEENSLNDNQYLTFVLEDELFALNIGTVREVLELASITKVPRTPEFIRGVINLRGRAVPVVDLRMKFGMGETRRTVNTCIIIVEVELDGEATVLGALADSVQEVYEMESSQIEPPPRMGTRIKSEFITGMGKSGDRFIVILDINKVFSAEELSLAADAIGAPGTTERCEGTADAGV
ncbi:chemotaxis protein CheW [Desulfolutivibrio sulfoxidireducens]|uniref:chemotaxis protein CheW n=1 Tax=Desulfolutivibrio sulfoxidireducens TaxID=2773299 RepID=UPI00159DB0D0|nr:chemotaxis protein CheW [Desulfolutivibrio sulfoxidireducens]QLA16397.1 chemotaxis protein CheW [Desulfolutivibrio sulfoxidireducens]QLA19722.1 chemotaxis protein CheW [Desulfolutivibrio sulfoxidireducens]